MVYTKVVTNKSPWLRKAVLDQIYAIPASHGEGRFVASKEWIEKLFKNGQVATQYVNLNGEPTMDDRYNPNGSYYAIEGITSPVSYTHLIPIWHSSAILLSWGNVYAAYPIA